MNEPTGKPPRSGGKRQPGRPTSATFSRDELITAALRLIDDHGFPEFGLRPLAAQLGVTHRAVHHRCGSRDQLLVWVVDALLDRVFVPSRDLPWEDWMRLTAAGLRRQSLEHPNAAGLLLDLIQLSDHGRQLLAVGLDVLLQAGATPTQAAAAYNTFSAYVLGSSVLEPTGAARLTVRLTPQLSRLDDIEGSEAFRERLAQAPHTELPPHTTAGDVVFSEGLEIVLAGIRAMLNNKEETGPTKPATQSDAPTRAVSADARSVIP